MRKYLIARAFNKKTNPSNIRIELTNKDLIKGPRMWGFTYGTSDYILVSARKK